MKEWLFSLFCLIILFNVVLLFFSKKKILNTIKIVFGIIFLTFSVKPLVNLDLNNFEKNIITDIPTLCLEPNSANQIITEYKKTCNKIIDNLGISGANVVIEYSVENENYVNIKNVKIHLENCSYNGNINHKDIQRKLKECLSILLNLNEKNIIVSE